MPDFKDMQLLPEYNGEGAKALYMLKSISRIIELTEKEGGLTETFYNSAKIHIEYLGRKLHITGLQAILFSHFLGKCIYQSVRLEEIAASLHCNMITLLCYMTEFDELEKKRLLSSNRDGIRRIGDAGGTIIYRIPVDVINAIRNDEEYLPRNNKNIGIADLFDILENLFSQRDSLEVSYNTFVCEMTALIENNRHLTFSRNLRKATLHREDLVLLVIFFHLYINNAVESVTFRDFEFVYDNKAFVSRHKRLLRNGTHNLLTRNYIENSCDDVFGTKDYFHLTETAKTEFLSELENCQSTKKKNDIILCSKLTEKSLFYTDYVAREVERLVSLLQPDNLNAVQNRLLDTGMRTGFTCLFYGPPGTGKTETAYQLARKTGRDLMVVDISQTKSMWFGESEKKIKEIFARYRSAIKFSKAANGAEPEPILLFNEADAIIGKRKDITVGNITQTENTMQNIILDEMDKLTGILIATTNLTHNMDSAFERRFLFKIEFAKPDAAVRKSIWQSMIPGLSEPDAHELASRFDFSGGQIENIARKRTVEAVISGATPDINTLLQFCREEPLSKDSGRRIGFAV
jgi:hypothetical protein